MRSRFRLLAALLLACATTVSGLTVAPGIAAGAEGAAPTFATVPSGGCWGYVPSGPALDAPAASDISTELGPWTTVTDGGLLLETTGATAVGGRRDVAVTLVSGPVISTDSDVTGTASFLLSVDGEPLAAPIELPFATVAGEPAAGLVATTVLPISSAGIHQVRLDAVYFDAPAASLRVLCNGAEVDGPGGTETNPSAAAEEVPEVEEVPQAEAAPEADVLTEAEAAPTVITATPTDLTVDYVAAAASSVTVTSIDDQAVLDTARPGDTVSAQIVGLASDAPVSIQLCGPDAVCSAVADAVSGPDGSATTSFVVPGPAAVGAGTLQAGDGASTVSADLAILPVQTVTAAEKLKTRSTIVTLGGTGWDPTRPVTVRGYAGTNSSTDPTSDPEVVAEVDATGEFTAKFEVAAEDTESVIVDQARANSNIGAVYLISGVIGGAPGGSGGEPDNGTDAGTDTGTDAGTDTGTDAGTTVPPAVTPPVVAPPVLEVPGEPIPEPEDIPITEPETVPGLPVGEVPEDLSVTEVRLDGQATVAELFGGAPERDLIFLVTNVGDATVENPIVRVAVGRSEDLEAEIVDVEVGVLDPGEQSVVTVPLQLPMAAFGTYQVVGQVGDTELGSFDIEWTTYPWGLFLLNLLGLALLGLGLWSRMKARRPATYRPAPVAMGDDAVVDLAAAEAWWAYRSRGGVPMVAGGVPPARIEEVADDAVVDLDAAENWWARRSGNPPSQAS